MKTSYLSFYNDGVEEFPVTNTKAYIPTRLFCLPLLSFVFFARVDRPTKVEIKLTEPFNFVDHFFKFNRSPPPFRHVKDLRAQTIVAIISNDSLDPNDLFIIVNHYHFTFVQQISLSQ